jgi:hypothetical protein
MDLKQAMPVGGLVTADPGPAGLWVARTFPTDGPGTVVVPAVAAPGIGAAVGLAAARAGHPATAVTVGPVDEATRAVVDLANALHSPLTLAVWDDDVDLSLTELLVEAAGPVVAWGP